MKLMARRTRYSGTKLRPDTIDAAKALGDHQRDERMKNTITNIKIGAICVTALAIPALYGVILIVNWNDAAVRNEWLQKGLVGVIAFALGKVNFNFGDGKK